MSTKKIIKDNPEYKIGSIVYVMDNSSPRPKPAIIAEKSSVQTINGTRVTYKVSFDGKTLQELNTSWNVYVTIEELQEHAAEQITTIVSNIIKQTKIDAEALKKTLNKAPSQPTVHEKDNVTVINDGNQRITVHLPKDIKS